MFYVEFPKVENWEREKRSRYEELLASTALHPGSICLVNNGIVHALKKDVSYLKYADLLRQVPTYRGMVRTIPRKAGTMIVLDMYLENGLLLGTSVQVTLLMDSQCLTEKEGGEYLLLCQWEECVFQVIASEDNVYTE